MILAVQKGTLSLAQKNKLEKKGYVVIECSDPDKVRVINPEINVQTDDFFLAALFGLTSSNPIGAREHFINNLYKRLNKTTEL